jgi:hypothetical protein
VNSSYGWKRSCFFNRFGTYIRNYVSMRTVNVAIAAGTTGAFTGFLLTGFARPILVRWTIRFYVRVACRAVQVSIKVNGCRESL